MSCWGNSIFFVFKRPLAYFVTGLVLMLAAWKSYDILAWCWKRLSLVI
jgi:hypothetical protein